MTNASASPSQGVDRASNTSFLEQYSAVADAQHHPSHGASPFRKWLAMIRPERAEIRTLVLFTATGGFLALASPIAVEALVNSVAFGGLIQPVVVLTLMLLACLVFAAGLSALEFYLIELIQRRLFFRSAAKATLTLTQSAAFAGPHINPTVMVNRFLEVAQIQKVTATLLLDGIGILMKSVIGMIVLAFYHPVLLAFDIGLTAAIILMIFPLSRRGVATAMDESLAKHALVRWLEQLSQPGGIFHSRSGHQLGTEIAAALTNQYLEKRTDHFRIVFRQLIFGLAIQVLSLVLLLGLGGWLVIKGQMTLGQLVAAELIIAIVTGQLSKIGKYMESYYDLMASVDKLDSLLNREPERSGGETPEPAQGGTAVLIRSLAWVDDSHRRLFNRLQVGIEPGGDLAVIGGEGTGKTALCQILLGRRLPTEGLVELDGVDLRRWNLSMLRNRIAYVGEEPAIIEASLFENVRRGRESIDEDAVRGALATVELLDDILLWPDGLDTRIEADGSPLSRGQVRRMSLAAGLAGGPSLVLLDCLFDLIEPERRERIWKSLRQRYPATMLVTTRSSEVARLCRSTITLPNPESGAHRPGHSADREET